MQKGMFCKSFFCYFVCPKQIIPFEVSVKRKATKIVYFVDLEKKGMHTVIVILTIHLLKPMS